MEVIKIPEGFKIPDLNMKIVKTPEGYKIEGTIGDMLKSVYDTNANDKVDVAEMLKGTTTKTFGSVDVWGDKGEYVGINLFTAAGVYKGTLMFSASDYTSGLYIEGIGWKWQWDGVGTLKTGTIPVTRLKLSTGSYSEDIPAESNGTAFATNKYGHQIEVKGENSYIRLLTCPTYDVTTSWVAKKYQMGNTKPSAQTAYAQWSYHSASKQVIWGIWDKEEKRLTCVLIEEDEGYCKLFPELKKNQKLIKIKNPEKYEKLFAWDIMKLSKEKKIKENELEEVKGECDD